MDLASLALSEAELKEEEQRNTITELLHFASRGNVVRMKMIIAHRRVNVRFPPWCLPPCRLFRMLEGINQIHYVR